MGNKSIKVLIQARDLRVGSGIATCLMNYYENIVKSGFSVDFLLNRVIDSPHMQLIQKYGSRVFILPEDTNKPSVKNLHFIKEIVDKKYDIIHVNISGINSCLSLYYANKHGIKYRIYHGHSILEKHSLKSRIRSRLYVENAIKNANVYAACSQHAGKSLFGDKRFYIIHNVFDIDRFRFSEADRTRLRKEFDVHNNIVIGAVGRIVDSKNPFFTIDIFRELISRQENCILWWIGEGEKINEVRRYIHQNNLEEKITLFGNRDDVNKLYSAMDLFVLPTKFEGLGLVFLEAQASGLTCFASDVVPKDVLVTDNIITISLNKSASEWADYISLHLNDERKELAESSLEHFKLYDKTANSDAISKMYEEILKGEY